jgi:hypothetical protein
MAAGADSHELRADGGGRAETAGRSGSPDAPCGGSEGQRGERQRGKVEGIDLHVATERQQPDETKGVPVDGLPEGSSVLQQMQIVRPVFGYMKKGREFRRRFSFRGLGNVRSE